MPVSWRRLHGIRVRFGHADCIRIFGHADCIRVLAEAIARSKGRPPGRGKILQIGKARSNRILRRYRSRRFGNPRRDYFVSFNADGIRVSENGGSHCSGM